jgi:putative transposase
VPDKLRRYGVVHAVVYNLFNHGRHSVRAEHYVNLRDSAFVEWSRAVAQSE